MANPIADTAEYFAKRKSRFRRPDAPPALALASRTENDHRANPTTPDSPQCRQGLSDPSNADPGRWSRVLAYLPLLKEGAAGPRETSDKTLLEDEDSEDEDERRISEDSDMLGLVRNSQRLSRAHQRSQSARLYDMKQEQEDDRLPSAYDIQPEEEEKEEESNYFTKPFADQDRTSAKTAPELGLESPEVSQEPSSTTGAQSRWNRAVGKARLLASLSPRHRAAENTAIQNVTLAPYYPPAFDPIFIALSRDESGRKLPPILLPCISVAVTDSEFLAGVNQWTFRVELQYGDIKWVIRRTIADFVALHYTLLFKSSLSDSVPAPPVFPNQLNSLIRSAKVTIGLDRQEDEDGEEAKEDKEASLDRRRALTEYLYDLFQRAHMLVSYDICAFIEISAISIVHDMGWKGKEGYLKNHVNTVATHCCIPWRISQPWATQWVLIRDSYIAFCADIASTDPTDVLLLDKNFSVTVGEPGMFGNYHLTLANHFRRIQIKGSKRELDEWLECIQQVQKESPWVRSHRFSSFAPIRQNAKVKWFVDAENHFNAVAEAILSAKSEIYIADWWLTPELYLRRPPEENEDFRIDRLLQRKASEGVMIYIAVYKEMSLALTINSAHTKQWLQNLHPNILVQRHPDLGSVENSILLWSHHEKIVVVDNRLAFIGGLDLCFGRYDTHSHQLADYSADGHEKVVFPGQDYSNPREKDFADVAQHDLTLVDRTTVPRMPWHDVTLAVVGPIARDISRHFIQRWNFLKASKSMHRSSIPFLMPKGEFVAARDESKFTGTCRAQLLRSSSQWSSGVEREHSIYNAYMECIAQAKHFIYIENQFFISATDQDKNLRNKIGQAMVERIKKAHKKGEKFKIFIVIPLIPAFMGDLASSESSSARAVMHFQYVSISRGGNSIMEKLQEAGIEPSDYIGWYSLRNWDKISPRRPNDDSAIPSRSPFDDPESVLSDTSKEDTSLDDRSTEETMADDRNDFVSELLYIHDKLMIVDDRLVLMGSANINDRSQLGNRDSEIAMLVEDTEVVPSFMDGVEYKAAKFAHTLRMQLWKEHLGLIDFNDWDKLLDKTSFESGEQGRRQSHHYRARNKLAHHVSDLGVGHRPHSSNAEDIRFCEANEPVKVLDNMSRSCSLYDTFRTQHSQHKKRTDAAALDPLTDHCYNQIWRRTAENNTLIYRDLFRCVPDDTVHTFEQHRKFVPPKSIPYGHVANPELSGTDIREQLDQIQGHLVQFPTDYLKDESLVGSNLLESVTPMIIFT